MLLHEADVESRRIEVLEYPGFVTFILACVALHLPAARLISAASAHRLAVFAFVLAFGTEAMAAKAGKTLKNTIKKETDRAPGGAGALGSVSEKGVLCTRAPKSTNC